MSSPPTRIQGNRLPAEFELCGATAQAHGWIKEDVLARNTELVQQGFVKISES